MKFKITAIVTLPSLRPDGIALENNLDRPIVYLNELTESKYNSFTKELRDYIDTAKLGNADVLEFHHSTF